MLYLIGLGLNVHSVSAEARAIIEKCDSVYLESYTVSFPYSIDALNIKKEIVPLDREDVESDRLISEATDTDIALLVYGSPLFATTHTTLLADAYEKDVDVKILYNASVFDALGGSGLHLYSFGKIASMPAWKEGYEPDSFMRLVEGNQKIDAHSLILVDIGLSFVDAIGQLRVAAKNQKVALSKVLVGSRLGTSEEMYMYGSLENLREKNIEEPFCFVIPGKIHFTEEVFLQRHTIALGK